MSFDTVKIKVVNSSGNPLPSYATPSAAGMDVRAMLDEAVVIAPGTRALIPTGLKAAVPDGYEMQLRPRSGLALKNGITLLNTPELSMPIIAATSASYSPISGRNLLQ